MATASSNPFAIRILPGLQTSTLPEWVPPVGYFADVPMRNYPQDVTPAIYQNYPGDTEAMGNPFRVWGGSAILRDFSPLGAQVYYSGGHEASYSLPNLQFSLICDFSTLLWSVANVPLQANIANSFVDGLAADGTPYVPHTYIGLQEVPAAWGGGPRGSLASFFWAGNKWDNRINLLDVSRPTMGYSILATRQSQNADPTKIRFTPTAGGGNHPITVMDQARQGWWVAISGSVTYTLFVHRTGEITQYPALGGNLQNGSMALCDSLNLLVVIDGGYKVGRYASQSHRTLHIRDLGTGVVTKSITLGDVSVASYHRPDVMGLQWVEELGCVVGLDQSVQPPVVVKLIPPASNPATAQWTWSVVQTLQHWPQDEGGQTELQSVLNNYWSKFRWVPSLQAFVVGTGKDRKPQVIRLA
jgi:hypothetical protein